MNNKKTKIDSNLADNSDLFKKIKELRDINLKQDFKIDTVNFPTPEGDDKGGNNGNAAACVREKEIVKRKNKM